MGMIASAMTWVPDGESVDDMSICDDSWISQPRNTKEGKSREAVLWKCWLIMKDCDVDYRVEIGAVWFEKVLERLHIGECKDWCAELSVWVFGMIAGWVGLEISNN
jgi:hypothetical protein